MEETFTKAETSDLQRAQATNPAIFLCNGLLVMACSWLTDSGYGLELVLDGLDRIAEGLPYLGVIQTSDGAAKAAVDPLYVRPQIDAGLYHEFAFSMATTLLSNLLLAGVPWSALRKTIMNMDEFKHQSRVSRPPLHLA